MAIAGACLTGAGYRCCNKEPGGVASVGICHVTMHCYQAALPGQPCEMSRLIVCISIYPAMPCHAMALHCNHIVELSNALFYSLSKVGFTLRSSCAVCACPVPCACAGASGGIAGAMSSGVAVDGGTKVHRLRQALHSASRRCEVMEAS